MPELPVLGLRVGTEVSPVRQKIERRELLITPGFFTYKERVIEQVWGMLQENLGLDSSDLIDAFALDRQSLRWRQLYHPNAMSAFFIASGIQEPFDLDQSQAILEVISKVKEGKIKPQELAVSTVGTDSRGAKRIIAVGYNLENQTALRAGISLTHTEIPIEDLEQNEKCFEQVPGMQNSIYKSPQYLGHISTPRTIITPTMTKQTANHDLFLRVIPHPRGGVYFEHPRIEHIGFRVKSLANTHQIGYKRDENEWGIQYPALLTKC